jgi:hypothetical protein
MNFPFIVLFYLILKYANLLNLYDFILRLLLSFISDLIFNKSFCSKVSMIYYIKFKIISNDFKNTRQVKGINDFEQVYLVRPPKIRLTSKLILK